MASLFWPTLYVAYDVSLFFVFSGKQCNKFQWNEENAAAGHPVCKYAGSRLSCVRAATSQTEAIANSEGRRRDGQAYVRRCQYSSSVCMTDWLLRRQSARQLIARSSEEQDARRPTSLLTDRASEQGNAISHVRPSVRFHSGFRTD